MIGEKIRRRRNEIDISMKVLADRTGLSPGFISQVERELTEPSITSLRKIAKALGVAVFYFFTEEKSPGIVVKKNDRQSRNFPQSHLTYELLSPDLNRQMEMFLATLEPGAQTCEEPLAHNGEEVTHVLEGTMWIGIGDDEYILDGGDTIYYHSSQPHRIVNKGKGVLKFISTITPPMF